jgi:hypothetical protein
VSTNSVNIRALAELSNTYMILFNIGGFLTSKILEHTIDDIFHLFSHTTIPPAVASAARSTGPLITRPTTPRISEAYGISHVGELTRI